MLGLTKNSAALAPVLPELTRVRNEQAGNPRRRPPHARLSVERVGRDGSVFADGAGLPGVHGRNAPGSEEAPTACTSIAARLICAMSMCCFGVPVLTRCSDVADDDSGYGVSVQARHLSMLKGANTSVTCMRYTWRTRRLRYADSPGNGLAVSSATVLIGPAPRSGPRLDAATHLSEPDEARARSGRQPNAVPPTTLSARAAQDAEGRRLRCHSGHRGGEAPVARAPGVVLLGKADDAAAASAPLEEGVAEDFFTQPAAPLPPVVEDSLRAHAHATACARACGCMYVRLRPRPGQAQHGGVEGGVEGHADVHVRVLAQPGRAHDQDYMPRCARFGSPGSARTSERAGALLLCMHGSLLCRKSAHTPVMGLCASHSALGLRARGCPPEGIGPCRFGCAEARDDLRHYTTYVRCPGLWIPIYRSFRMNLLEFWGGTCRTRGPTPPSHRCCAIASAPYHAYGVLRHDKAASVADAMVAGVDHVCMCVHCSVGDSVAARVSTRMHSRAPVRCMTRLRLVVNTYKRAVTWKPSMLTSSRNSQPGKVKAPPSNVIPTDATLQSIVALVRKDCASWAVVQMRSPTHA